MTAAEVEAIYEEAVMMEVPAARRDVDGRRSRGAGEDTRELEAALGSQ